MTLTLGTGPLATSPVGDRNYRIEGPAHRILVQDHPRRIRIRFGGRTIVDTVRGRLLHESNLLPVLYVPLDDVDDDAITPTDHTTHCPFKGDASYWTLAVDGRVAENAAWGYLGQADRGSDVGEAFDPSLARAIDGHVAFYLDRVDEVLEEDEPVVGHLRDPYHRVDARRSSRHVVVRVGDRVVAETRSPMVVYETGLPPRFYVPEDDVTADLVDSDTTTTCAYKGVAAYRSLPDGPQDVAFSYPDPLPEGQGLQDHWCFLGDEVETEVDARPIAS